MVRWVNMNLIPPEQDICHLGRRLYFELSMGLVSGSIGPPEVISATPVILSWLSCLGHFSCLFSAILVVSSRPSQLSCLVLSCFDHPSRFVSAIPIISSRPVLSRPSQSSCLDHHSRLVSPVSSWPSQSFRLVHHSRLVSTILVVSSRPISSRPSQLSRLGLSHFGISVIQSRSSRPRVSS